MAQNSCVEFRMADATWDSEKSFLSDEFSGISRSRFFLTRSDNGPCSFCSLNKEDFYGGLG